MSIRNTNHANANHPSLESYEQLILEEDQLILKQKTCQHLITVVLDANLLLGDVLHALTVEQALLALNGILNNLNTDLLLLRHQKGIFANRLGKRQA